MNILDVYFPLFSYAAHGGSPAEYPRLASLARADADARFANRPGLVAAAWLPVAAWLGETAYPEREFKERADSLLLAAASGTAADDGLDLLRLHILCLELGYGKRENAAAEENRRRYIRRCRQAVADADASVSAAAPRKTARHTPLLRRRALRAASVLLAPAATLGLYWLYRGWLRSLFADILG